MSSEVTSARAAEATPPIAIIGMGCRFPGGATTPSAFWQVLLEGRDTITEIPRDRFDTEPYFDPSSPLYGKLASRAGGYIDDPIAGFDPLFFGIAPREAVYMDPQHRLLLEVGWEALEDAGQVPERIAGSRTGVFVGIWTSDYETRLCRSIADVDLRILIGGARYAAAGRLSFAFDLRGPSMSLDTACSSAMVAVHLACESIWSGSATMALAGGVNVILEPFLHAGGFRSGTLSEDGRCKFGDASASGYVRSEGAAIMVLKPLANALTDGDPIYAVIRGTAVNNDGRSSGLLSAPGVETQVDVMRHALRRAGVEPAQVSYVEAHGTGTPVGDPIEVTALATVFAEGRPPERPCLIGSAKTNFGHAEAAAGMVSLMKAALCLKHRQIPPSLHFENPNPGIAWSDLPVRLTHEGLTWPDEPWPAFAGANSFGITGTNAHVVLQEAPVSQPAAPSVSGSRLVPISAHTAETLQAMAQAYVQHARAGSDNEFSLEDVGYTAARRRTHHAHRLALVAANREELIDELEAFVNGDTRQGLITGRVARDGTCRPVFVFAGMGPQWWAMGRELFETEPVYRRAVEDCDAHFQPLAGWSLVGALSDTEAESRMDRTAVSQPAVFAVQVGLHALWLSWGVEPAAIVGHSTGEVAAAYASGVLSLRDAVKVIYHRSRLQDSTRGSGTMAAADLDAASAETLAREYGGRVSVAAINSPTSVTLSGDIDPIADLVTRLEAQGTFVRKMRVDTAFHSALMDTLREELLASLEGLELHPPGVPTYTTVTGGQAAADAYGPEYWWRNVRGTVQFASAMSELVGEGFREFLELSPHPVLSASILGCLAHAGVAGYALSSLRRQAPERAHMLASLGTLYTLGYPVDWARQYTNGRVVSLPTYQWQREHVWFEEDGQTQGGMHGAVQRLHPFLGAHIESALQPGTHLWDVEVNLAAFPYLKDHRVGQTPLFPAAGYFDAVLAAGIGTFGRGGCAIEDARLYEGLFLSETAPRLGQVVIARDGDGATFQFLSRPATESQWTLHVSGRLAAAEPRTDAPETDPLEEIRAACDAELSGAEHYREVRRRRLNYGPHFQAVRQLWQGPNEALGVLRLDDELQSQVGAHQVHPVLLDAAFQVLLATLGAADMATAPDATYLPSGIRRLCVYQPASQSDVWAHARLNVAGCSRTDTLVGDIDLLDQQGRRVASIEGLSLRKVERPLVEQISDWLYEPVWEPKPLALSGRAAQHVGGRWLVFADRGDFSDRLVADLVDAGARPIVVRDAAREYSGAGEQLVAPGDAFAMHALIEALTTRAESIDGVVYAWGTTPQVSLSDAQVRGPIGLMHLIQALAGQEQPLSPPLWIVTRGAAPVEAAPALELAPLWGVANVVAMEHPELQCRCVDLGDEADLAGLFAEIGSPADESQVALRGEQRYVARLARTALPQGSAAGANFVFRADAVYVVSGGLGGLGLAVAGDMLDHGAQHVVLLGRSDPSEDAQARIDRWRAAGADVRTRRCDVADAESVARVLAEIRTADLPPLRGIVHAAGVLDDGLLLQQTCERFQRVFAPKIAGAWNLHCQTLDEPLDLFVMFSSAAVLVGNPGQANYVAANAFMDALAHARRAQGRPGLSIGWGAWSEVGMAAAQAGRGDRLATRGLTSLNQSEGLAAFRAVLGSDRPQIGVMPFDVRRWCQSHPAAAQWSFLSALLAQARAEDAEATGDQTPVEDSLRERLCCVPPAERRPLLEKFVLEQVGRVSKMAPSRVDRQAPMQAMGFDSLMALELRSRLESGLGLTLSPTIAFNYPTACALTDYLAGKLDILADEAGPPNGTTPADHVLLAQILEGVDAVSTSELAELISGAAGS